MKSQIPFLFLAALSAILPIIAPAKAAESAAPPNILLICIDDLRPELKSFGADYIHSPNIDKLAAAGRAFHRHYVNAPSCGPSRFTLLTGRYGAPGNDALFKRSEQLAQDSTAHPPSMPEWFRKKGYTTVSVGKVSHHPGGRGGPDWNDPNIIEMPNAWDRHLMPVGEWQHPRGSMHGLAHGEIRINRGDMDVFQAAPGSDKIYPDGLTINEALNQLGALASDKNKPFLLAVGILKPHLPFGAPKKYFKRYQNADLPATPHPEKPQGLSTWHDSGEFMGYNRWGRDPNEDDAFALEVRRYYAACVTYADAQVGRLMKKLKQTGADKNTIVVVWGDHGWNLGEHAIWGKHNLYEEALRSPLIINYPGLEKRGQKTDALVETLDLFPTLCELSGIPTPDFAQGTSLVPIIQNPNTSGHPAFGYWKNLLTLRTDTHRLILHKNGDAELYDHTQSDGETVNRAAEQPETLAKLKQLITQRASLLP